ncbi:MAG: hypothetical protein DRI65_17700 [Chloroflexota bacterium]|nr:MAG: hypothetical protein DRI65_17700 [Chloroflexota bacterium]
MNTCKAAYRNAWGSACWYGKLCGKETKTNLCTDCKDAGRSVCHTVKLRKTNPAQFQSNLERMEDMS